MPHPPRAALLLIAALAAACGGRHAPAPAPDPASLRRLPEGDVVGAVGGYGAHVWRGIPYARPPVGARRWRAPEPPAPWSGVREALVVGAPCVQYASGFGDTDGAAGTPVGDEDCLVLDVFAPRMDAEAARGARLPVMVWIHGGGNSIGRGAFYDGGNLARTHGVVVVTVNYRLGPFGWFRHAALREGASVEEASGNFALLDLRRALEWVRDAAPAFGGDPGNVTVFGESAGGANVLALLLVPSARGLFHRAIAQSPGVRTAAPAQAEGFAEPGAGGPQRHRSGEIALRLLVSGAGDRAAAREALAARPADGTAAALRALPAAAVLRAYAPQTNGMVDLPRMFRDGVVLPDAPWDVAFAMPGAAAAVPIVLGSNRDESRLFLAGDPSWVRRILWIFPRLRDPERYDAVNEHASRMWTAVAVDGPATGLRRAGHDRLWVYRFDWDEEARPLGIDLPRILGAAHAFEIPFVFGHFDLGRLANRAFDEANRPGREALAAQMMSYWTEFALRGDPGRGRDGTLPVWRPRAGDRPDLLVFDTKAGGGVRMESQLATRADVLEAVERDPRLATPRWRCAAYRVLAERVPGMDRGDYPDAPGGRCAEFPFDAWPWT